MTTTARPRPVRRLRWILPALLVIVWLAVGGFGGPFAGKLSSVQQNDSTSFLPASAEATEVSALQKGFTDTQFVPAIVVAERTSGITAADTEFLAGTANSFAGSEGFGDEVSPPIPSADGRALQMFVPVDGAGEVGDSVTELRDALGAAPGGLTVLVTGPAGQVADLSAAFAGIDGLLLLVAGVVVILILVVVYRSPILPFAVITSAVFALGLSSLLVYLLADAGVIALNGQSQGILFILVFGAATDYALLLVSRYREELRIEQDKYRAMRTAWRATLEPVAASAGTVIAGVLCLLLSDLNSNRGLGPVAAIGIAASFVASMTYLPAVLVLLGRTAYWPSRPAFDARHAEKDEAADHKFWAALAARIGAHPRRFWVASSLVLVLFALLMPQFEASGVAESETFLLDVDSVAGQQILGDHFDAGSGSPAVIIANEGSREAVADAARVDGVGDITVLSTPGTQDPLVVDGRVAIEATLTDPADSLAAEDTIVRLRDAVHPIDGADALVGGTTATDLDTKTTSTRDRTLIIPVVILVVFTILCLLLRSLLAPLLLMGTVVLSFAATLGISSLVFEHIFGFPGADPVVPLFAFVFLVALGIDYNIFLMTRVREEARRIGTRRGALRGLTVTGGVITSAGVVLAATFSALAVIPLIFLAQIAFIVAFGVLLDALLVRSLLVPALTVDIGQKIWWPSKLASASEPDENVSAEPELDSSRM
ncbi:MMPL family transporter [Rhodococcus opacus]|uniref:MMPL family transporter n=1 Tax=Rhodococcus opacus TaxID=37919 RepID=UPI00031DDBCD|nr:MMPL family transporter [Rhodococcus opacus]AHK34703.1 Putative membrane protein [Rhodococcus opacus PD630]UDG96815.1 MMPL family transporter [Rhodococcus opacus PD630]